MLLYQNSFASLCRAIMAAGVLAGAPVSAAAAPGESVDRAQAQAMLDRLYDDA